MEKRSSLEGAKDNNVNEDQKAGSLGEKQNKKDSDENMREDTDIDNLLGKKVESIELADRSQSESTEDETALNERKGKDEHKKVIKNLISAVIVLSGVATGSFFVDIVQFASGSGYSEKALQKTNVFVAGDKTWVAFKEPAIEVQILTVKDDELEDCENCDPSMALVWLKRFIPTLIAKKVDVSSPEGKEIIKAYNLKSIPAFVFSSSLKESEFYNEEAKVLFEKKKDKFVLNAVELGIPVGRYLETPEISENDAQRGNKDAKVKIVVYSDFQCPYSKRFFSEITKVTEEFNDDQVLLVYKNAPIELHPRGEISAIVACCARDQGKFWEMGKILYDKQSEWSNADGTGRFKEYARSLSMDAKKFNECLDNKSHFEEIQRDKEEAESFGTSGVPVAFINEQFVSGIVGEDKLRSIINDELKK
ncbi:MAG: thioredoxin domain-containing protein [Patescibacteria group bacterium]|nr:thioredoxin domain-containing protein [Patescibacteria group bacterium]